MTRRLWISALTLTAGLASAGTAVAQSGQPPAKLKKQIVMMERIVDETLIESKALLVPGHDVTRGIYLEEFGVLFTLEASVITPENEDWWEKLHGDEDEDEDSGKNKKKAEEREKTRKEIMKIRQENYEKGKTEIRGVLLDYGGTLGGLRDDQWVGIVAFIDDDFFGEDENDTVVFRAKMSDLRAHDAGRMNDRDMQGRVSIEEY